MQCFKIRASEIEARLDAGFYSVQISNKFSNSFKTMPLGQIINFSKETWNQKTYKHELTFPYIEISEIDLTSGEIKNIPTIEILHAPSRARMIVREGDIIVSTTRPSRGAIARIAKDHDGYIASTGFSILRELKTDVVEKDFLFFVLREPFCLKQMEQYSSGGNYPAINAPQLKLINIPIPELIAQKRIIDLMDTAYASKKAQEAEADQLLASIDDYVLSELGITLPVMQFKNSFTVIASKIESKRFDTQYYKPEFVLNEQAIINGRYRSISLGGIATDLKNGVEIRRYKTTGFRYLRVTDLTTIGLNDDSPRFVDVAEIPKKIKLLKNDFLISRSGSLGLVSCVNDNIINSILSSHIFKVTLNLEKIYLPFLEAFLRTKVGQSQFKQKNNGGVIPEINQSALKSILISLPPLDIQQKIAAEVQSRMEQAQALKREAAEGLEKAKKQVESIILGK